MKLAYLLMGAAAGAAAGMLLAPQPGRKTRKYMNAKAREGADYLKSRADDVVQKATEMVDRGKEEVEFQMGRIEKAVQAFSNASPKRGIG